MMAQWVIKYGVSHCFKGKKYYGHREKYKNILSG